MSSSLDWVVVVQRKDGPLDSQSNKTEPARKTHSQTPTQPFGEHHLENNQRSDLKRDSKEKTIIQWNENIGSRKDLEFNFVA